MSAFVQTVEVRLEAVNESSCVHPVTWLGPAHATVLARVNSIKATSPTCAPAGMMTCLNFWDCGSE